MSNQPLRILVLADTHNNLPSNLEEFAAETDEIWHLGDLCVPALLTTIREVGPPVTIVRGNCDSSLEWPITADLERNGLRFRLTHIAPARPPENIDVLLHGHTHVPRDETQGGVRFLNPGCVTRPNRGAPPSLAHMAIGPQGEIEWRLTRLR